MRRKARCGDESLRVGSGVEPRLGSAVTRYRRREEALARAREELLAELFAARAAGTTLARIVEIVGISRQWLLELLEREASIYHLTHGDGPEVVFEGARRRALAALLEYLDERSPENELALSDASDALEVASARRAPSQHDQAVELRERLAVVR